MTEQLVVAIEGLPSGLVRYHCALVKSRPAGRRRGRLTGRTLPAATWLESLCAKVTSNLTPALEIVDLERRSEADGWCSHCAGYLDHLDKAWAAEADRAERLAGAGFREAIAIMADGPAPDPRTVADAEVFFAERNRQAMAQLGEQLTGVPVDKLLTDTEPHIFSTGVLDLPSGGDELEAKRELRRLAADDS